MMDLAFRFVGQGTMAPDPVHENELWLDVGGRTAAQVVDHHGGDTDAWCAAQLVFERYQELILDPLSGARRVTCVLHSDPGLDGTTSAWLARSVFDTGRTPEPAHAVATIVQSVAENDQGFVRTEDPQTCWAIVVRLVVATQAGGQDDLGQVRLSFALLDSTLAALREGHSLEHVTRTLMTPTVRAVIGHAERDYAEDLMRSERFQVRLPVRLVEPWIASQEDAPQDRPDFDEERWSLTDGLYLHDPASSLFRELARGDRKNSPLGQGFGLLVVAREQVRGHEPPLWRHIISTDPMSGLHLRGLGKALEELEEAHEDASEVPLLPGRERVESGLGRHGYNVRSPWYDGRAHAFTIIDSPLVQVNDRDVCASILSPGAVLEALWSYGDPNDHIGVEEAVVTIFKGVRLDPGWDETWSEEISLGELCPELCEEVRDSGINMSVRIVRDERAVPMGEQCSRRCSCGRFHLSKVCGPECTECRRRYPPAAPSAGLWPISGRVSKRSLSRKECA